MNEEKPIVILCHGVSGSSQSTFIPYIRSELDKLEIKSYAPDFPNSSDPLFDEWKQTFEDLLKQVWNGQNIIILGHSLGGYFVLRLLGESSQSEWASKLIGAVLIAPTSITRPKHRRFYTIGINWQGIREINTKIIHV